MIRRAPDAHRLYHAARQWFSRTFGERVEQGLGVADQAAVIAALAPSYCNVQVENQINRVKLIRARPLWIPKYDLLRQKALAA